MDHVELLKESIIDVVEKLQEYPKVSVISGNGEERVCETSIVEELMLSFFKNALNRNLVMGQVGREILYPHTDWEGNKLDIGLGPIEESKYLFKTAIEVKKWIGKMNPKEGGWVPQNIWFDIFKITGYQSKEYPNVGHNKFVLIFFETTKNSPYEDVLETLNKTFIRQDYLKEYLKRNARNVRSFVENYLKWSSGVQHALDYFGLTGEEQEIKAGLIELEPINGNNKVLYNPAQNIGAALLRIGPKQNQ